MGQRKYLIFSTGGRCQWLMKRWNRFSLFFSKLSPYQYPRVRWFSTRLSVYRLSGGSPVTSGRATRTFDAGAVRSWFLGPRGPLVEPSISPPVPSRPPARNKFSWVHRWAVTLPSGLWWWKLMMSAIQIWTKIQIQRQIQRQIKGKPMTPMMWYIFEKEMT